MSLHYSGKLEGYVNHAACGWIVTEATGIAAGLLAETGAAEIVEVRRRTSYAFGVTTPVGITGCLSPTTTHSLSRFMSKQDPLIAYVANHICDDAVSAIERHYHVGPEGICSDLGYGGRRRRSDAPQRPARTTATYTSYQDAKNHWTTATTARWIQLRTRAMQHAGTPVAVFPVSVHVTATCPLRPLRF